MSKFLFIINPISGKGKGKKAIPIIIKSCNQNNIDFAIIETKYRLHATQIVKENLDLFDFIISVGGDGTLNEVVNGFTKESNAVLGVLPTGSGNDFTQNIGFKNNLEENISIIIDSNSNIIHVDIGHVKIIEKTSGKIEKTHRFINSCGIGFDAFAGYLNQTNKRLSGVFSYLYAVIRALSQYHIMNTEIKIDNYIISGEKLLLSIGNGICSGGGFYLNPDAKINDGLLNFTVLNGMTRKKLLSVLPLALLNKAKSVKDAEFYESNSIEISLNAPYYIHCDGEIISTQMLNVYVEIEPNAIKVITNN